MDPKALPFVILASGKGSNARALLDYARANPALLKAVGLVSDRGDAPVLDIAREYGVETAVISSKSEGTLLAFLSHVAPQWACLAGYKKLVGEGFLDFFADEKLGFARVMNVHPSLLPAYPGLRGYERAFADGVKVSGVTVHLVDKGLDTGRPILQKAFARENGDDLASFSARGQKIEHELFPAALAMAARKQITIAEQNGSRWVSTENL